MFNSRFFSRLERGAVCVFETDKVYCRYRSSSKTFLMKKGHVGILWHLNVNL